MGRGVTSYFARHILQCWGDVRGKGREMTGDQAIRRMVPTTEGQVAIKWKLTRCRQRGAYLIVITTLRGPNPGNNAQCLL